MNPADVELEINDWAVHAAALDAPLQPTATLEAQGFDSLDRVELQLEITNRWPAAEGLEVRASSTLRDLALEIAGGVE